MSLLKLNSIWVYSFSSFCCFIAFPGSITRDARDKILPAFFPFSIRPNTGYGSRISSQQKTVYLVKYIAGSF